MTSCARAQGRSRDNTLLLPAPAFREAALAVGVRPGPDLDAVVRTMEDRFVVRRAGILSGGYRGEEDGGGRASGPEAEVFCLDVFWCGAAFRGLVRPERDAQLLYFGGRIKNFETPDLVPRPAPRPAAAPCAPCAPTLPGGSSWTRRLCP